MASITYLDLVKGRGPLYKFRQSLDDLLKPQFNSELFELPTLGTLTSSIPGLAEEMIFNYKRTYPITGAQGDVSEEMMIHQGMASSDLFFAIHADTGAYALYSADADKLAKIGSKVPFNEKKVYEQNIERRIHAKRLDITYLGDDEGSEDFEITSVGLSAKTALNVDDYIFVPYIVVARFTQLLKALLLRTRVLKTVVAHPWGTKLRYVTADAGLLAEYSDNPAAVAFMRVVYRPLHAMMYLPVLGAPSTTTGMTRLDIFSCDHVSVAKKIELENLVDKNRENPVQVMILNHIVEQWIADQVNYMAMNLPAFQAQTPDADPKPGLPVRAGYDPENDSWDYSFTIFNNSETTKKQMLKEITYLPREVRERIYMAIVNGSDKGFRARNYKSMYNGLSRVLKDFRPVQLPISPNQMRRLAQGSLRVVYTTQKAKMAVIYGSNNPNILAAVYGDGYFARLESEGVRKSTFLEMLKSTGDFEAAANFTGIGKNLINASPEEMHDFQATLAEENGDKSSLAYDSNSITIRDLFVIEDPEVRYSMYYKKAPLSRLFSVAELG